MRILMALSQLEVTGAEVYGTVLADELIRRGNRVWIVSDTLTKTTLAQYEKIEFNKRSMKGRLDQVKKLLKIIKENDIQVVHAHSRASSWAANIACKIAGIPLISTVHGRQPVHLSRKIIKGFGDFILPVCENIGNHLIGDLGVKREGIKVLRNPIDSSLYTFTKIGDRGDESGREKRPLISIIGRLSGPKGDVAYSLLSELYSNRDIDVQIVGGKEIPERFEKFRDRVKFLGYVDNVNQIMRESHVVIGAGRVAVEGILSGRATIAVGEAELLGVVDMESYGAGLASNFGDIGVASEKKYDFSKINEMVEAALKLNERADELLFLRGKIAEEFDRERIVETIEKLYQRVYVLKKKREIPVIMYHRVIDGRDEERGVHSNYTLKKDFEEQLKYLTENGFETVTFKDLAENRYKDRFDRGKKQIILTFDDGYEDNYRVAFPLLKKYNCRGVIYLMGEVTYNRWDVENSEKPEKKFRLMTDGEIDEMEKSGLIEFGAHTLTHPRLSELSDDEIRYEIGESKIRLERKLGCEIISFAYPYGDFDERVKKIVSEFGFQFVTATDRGSVCFSDDLMEIRRIGMFASNTLFNYRRKTAGNYNFIKLRRENRKKRR